ncbi:ribokinase [Flexivirga endophytica]|uniref:Ribokinase n=1 Tax=Flexivirga endophytica TaxID=1849103 RepID=A0A916X0M5_9MICO|nr:ribokinase [Flexivirga endophytica]GGB45624.1 ribokinase [Flexivirga endophytica]GHB66398.1 ribokinase [Flexivirga endophytica]
MTARVVVVGSINVDHTIALERFPRPGETLLASSLSHSVGGKGANQAVAAAKSGATVAMVGVLGDDPEGDTALHALQQAGVDGRSVRRASGVPTGSAWISVASGDNTILVVSGANHQWTGIEPSLQQDDIVLAQLEIPLPVVEAVAAAAGMFVLNAAPSQHLSDELLGHCDVLIVNEHELAEVSGLGASDTADPAAVVAASHALVKRGVTAVATTLGEQGAILCTADETFQVRAPVVEVVDSTGAGDAFCGVFAAQLAAGASISEALRFAVTAGSVSVQSATAQGSYADLAMLPSLVHRTPQVSTLFEQ